jgi:hypothetical protein
MSIDVDLGTKREISYPKEMQKSVGSFNTSKCNFIPIFLDQDSNIVPLSLERHAAVNLTNR